MGRGCSPASRRDRRLTPSRWSDLMGLILALLSLPRFILGHGIYEPFELVHRNRGLVAQLFFSIFTDQDDQEIRRFDLETVTHCCQLILAKPGGGDLGARDGLVMSFRHNGDVENTPALELGCMSLQLIELLHQLGIFEARSEDQQRAVT